jgi:transglutaminase-like putative cysteine protease
VAAAPALVIAAAWLHVERPQTVAAALAALALGLAPAFVVRPAARAAAAFAAAVLVGRIAFGVWPGRELGTRFRTGLLDFYDVRLPFDSRLHTDMRGAVVVAVFGFVLALGLAVAARRALLAALVLLVGAGWPATLIADGDDLARGALILLGVLALLAGLRGGRLPRVALPAAAVVALVAVGVSSSSAVAKRELVHWQGWDFYDAPQEPVSVSYVWDAQYGGIRFPAQRTTVLKIKAPARSLYWRATTLDTFAGDGWLERRANGDPPSPAPAQDRRSLVREDVTVEALNDIHLVGGSEPVDFDAGDAPLVRPAPGLALLPQGLTRGFRYTAWSYAPQPSPAALARSKPRYPAALVGAGGFLDVEPLLATSPFEATGRRARLRHLFAEHPELEPYEPLARVALSQTAGARTPYRAALDLESWLRYRGGFRYDEHPPTFAAEPLVGFVVQTRRGYCQHFAGAMALMLRYLGIPARVAEGFTSGTYDAKRGVWTVTDHDAHAWVEAWFRGYGWLPFDPTPGRGRLDAAYSAASPRFRRTSGALARELGIEDPADIKLERAFGERLGSLTGGLGAAGGSRASARSHGRGGDLLELLALVLVGIAAVIVLAKLVLRRARYASRDPRRVAAACRQELADFLLDQGLDVRRGATLHELGALVATELSVQPADFVAAASAARFGRPERASEAARRARRELRVLVRQLRRRLTRVERARGLLSLRSLGLSS